MSHDINPKNMQAIEPVSIWQAFLFWLKLGFISFGGPAGQISIMHQELVVRRHWLSEKRFMHALNFCMVLPGPEAQQLATYIGWLMHKTRGGVVAGTLFVLPSLIILITLSWLYVAYGHVPLIASFFYGIKPAVTAIVAQASYRIGSRVLQNVWMWGIAATSFVAIFMLNTPFPLIVITAAVIGFLGGRFEAFKFASKNHGSSPDTYGAAVIDDNTPTPEHAVFTWVRLFNVLLVGVSLWAIPLSFLVLMFGWQHMFTQMVIFFSKAALLTFGGAYAVLPYVYQGAVEHFAWLNAVQMMDGLALGETTPGPLIMVVAFVGFVGAYDKALLGQENLFVAASLAAVLVTWFTFLPSFIFILAGGPWVESTHDNLNFTAPLSAVSASVVAVIVNLTLYFGYHVFWPDGMSGMFDVLSGLLFLASILALIKYGVHVIHVLLACGIVGIVVRLL